MFDLQVLALQGDITRVITFQLARETSNRSYPEIGVRRSAPPDVASRRRSREGGEDREDQPVPRVAVRVFPREAELDSRSRRHAARQLALSLRQRHGQSERAQPRRSADCGRRRRGGQGEGRTAHQVRRAVAAREPASDDARRGGRAARFVPGQHRKNRHLVQPG